MTSSSMVRCRLCGRRFKRPKKGRPRVYCTRCAPPGTKHPERLSQDFPQAVASADQAQVRHAARAAAMRAVAKRHPEELTAELAAQLAKRGAGGGAAR